MALVLLLAVNGCTSDGLAGGKTVSPDQAVSELKARPDIDQIMEQYNQLLEHLRTELTAAGFTGPWRQFDAANSAACNEFGDTDAQLNAEVRFTPAWGTTGISEENWPQALSTFKRLAEAAGFTTTEVVKDQPGDHILAVQGPYGSVLDFGAGKNTSLSISSGCHRLAGQPSLRQDS